MHVSDNGNDLVLNGSPFIPLFGQDNVICEQHVDLVINASEKEFSNDECLDLPIDTDTDSDSLESCKSRVRFDRFERESKSIVEVNPVSLYRNTSSNDVNLVEEDSGQLSSTDMVSAGSVVYLEVSEFQSVICLVPKEESMVGCSEEFNDSSEKHACLDNLTRHPERTDELLSISPGMPARLHQHANEHTEVLSNAMPTQNVFDRIGPKVHPCEKVVIDQHVNEHTDVLSNAMPVRNVFDRIGPKVNPCEEVIDQHVNEHAEVLSNGMPAQNVFDRIGPKVHPCEEVVIDQHVNEHAEVLSNEMPAQNVFDRIGPKVHPCEEVVIDQHVNEHTEVLSNGMPAQNVFERIGPKVHPCEEVVIDQHVNEHTEVLSNAMPAQNVFERIGPKVHPCEEVIIIDMPCKIATGAVDEPMSQHDSDEFVAEARSLPDPACESLSSETSSQVFNEIYESPRTALSDSSENSSHSLPTDPDVNDDVSCQVAIESPSSSEPFPKVSAPYLSNDPEENKANTDPKWEDNANLGTEKEYYEVVSERWKNSVKPNPNKNLIQQNHRKQMGRFKVVDVNFDMHAKNRNKRKRSITEPFEMVGPLAKRFRSDCDTPTCNTLFHSMISEVNTDFVNMKRASKSNMIEENRSLEQEIFVKSCLPSQNRQQLQNRARIYKKEIMKNYVDYLNHLKNESQYKIKILNDSKHEIIAVQHFYCGSSNADKLSKQQVTDFIEQEQMYSAYNDWYQ